MHSNKKNMSRTCNYIMCYRLGRLANTRVGGDEERDPQTFIADLSDLVRPTALALRLSELYNNEWTLAYESMISKAFNERKIVLDLLGCITVSLQLPIGKLCLRIVCSNSIADWFLSYS
jgi:hypothetical protein